MDNICKVEIVKLAGYVPGVKTTMDRKSAELLEKAGSLKILSTESNKMAPEMSKKDGRKK